MKIVRLVLVVAVLAASGFFVAGRAPVQAQTPELPDPPYDCGTLNLPNWDTTSHAGGTTQPFEFKAGDTIKVVASLPPGQEPQPGEYVIELLLESVPVKSAPLPGQITHTFTSDTTVSAGMPSVGWHTTSISTAPPQLATWQVSCSPAPAQQETSSEPVPGCDLGMTLTADAAVGAFVADTDVYWGPDANATTGISMPAGKTAWVLGVDESGGFYKFVWSCTYLWAPVSALGPNHDAVWNGTPLPATVVE
jgi:hypothetical protein